MGDGGLALVGHGAPAVNAFTSAQHGFGNIKTKLLNTFGSKLLIVTTFGSYERDTILPRKYDRKTDVDILVKFNHAALDKSVSTYREWLLDFANVNYARSSAFKITVYSSRVKEILKEFYALFQGLNAAHITDVQTAQIMKQILEYETTVAWANIPLDNQNFSKNRLAWDAQWKDIKARYNVK